MAGDAGKIAGVRPEMLAVQQASFDGARHGADLIEGLQQRS